MKIVVRDILFVVVAGLYLTLMIGQRLYPFIDLPNHLSEAVIYKDPAAFQGFYSVSERISPNDFHYVFCSAFSNIETGNKIFYCVYVLLFLTIGYLIMKRWKGNLWFLFLLFLLLLNYNVTYGFVGFTLGIPIVMLIYYLLSDDHILAKGKNIVGFASRLYL